MQVNEVHNTAACNSSRIQVGEGVAFHVGSKAYDMHILES